MEKMPPPLQHFFFMRRSIGIVLLTIMIVVAYYKSRIFLYRNMILVLINDLYPRTCTCIQLHR